MIGISLLHNLLIIKLTAINKNSNPNDNRGTKKNWNEFFIKSMPRSNISYIGILLYSYG
jgi:hypothetical protein